MTTVFKNNRIEERQFLRDCIILYRDLPALWKVKSEEYKNRLKKKEAYRTLLCKYNEMYPEATVEDLKKRINALRSNFRKELRKVTEFKSFSGDSDVTYEPTLWYFKEMEFLIDQEFEDSSLKTPSDDEISNLQIKTKQTVLRKKLKRKKFIEQKYSSEEDSNEKESCAINTKELPVLISKRSDIPENEYNICAKSWAIELQKMDYQQQLFAKKAINEILFEGQMGTLHRNSVQINKSLENRSSSPIIIVSQNNM